MNIPLLKAVRDKIASEPHQFEMAHYFTRFLDCKDAHKIKIPDCGTACCIAGWALAIHKGKKPNVLKDDGASTGREAAGVLGIDHIGSECLFHESFWPSQFKSLNGIDFSYLTKKQQAKLAVKRINHFIRTNGEE